MNVFITKPISFLAGTKAIRIEPGQTAWLDQNEGIAFRDGVHFFVAKDEYAAMN